MYTEVDNKGQKQGDGYLVKNLRMVHFIQKPGILLDDFKKNQKFNQIHQQEEKNVFVISNNCK